MTYHRAVQMLGDKNEASMSDGVFTFMILGLFRVGLLALFFSLGAAV